MSAIEPRFMSLCEEMYYSDEEQESCEDYGKGGHLCVEIGDTLHEDRYRVIRELGFGTFSTVWLCSDTKLNDYVAIKVIKGKKSYYETSLEEIRTLTAIQNIDRNDSSSKRVVTLLNHFVVEGVNGKHRCLVFEVLGQSLYTFMKKSFPNGIPIETLKGIVKQILEGLQYLHTKCKIIHSDIKPENILLVTTKTQIEEMDSKVNNKLIGNFDERQHNSLTNYNHKNELFFNKSKTTQNIYNLRKNCRIKRLESSSHNLKEDVNSMAIKIADFGNSFYLDDVRDFTIQTRPYRSPEVILGAGFDTSADIWSTACTIWELATGHHLFNLSDISISCMDSVHLIRIMELLGPLPKECQKGRHYSNYFSKRGRLLGSKMRRESSRPTLYKLLTLNNGWTPSMAQSFSEFLLAMLAINPEKRANASQCLSHQWLKP